MAVTVYRSLGAMGIAKQSVQGTGVTPAKFFKNAKAAYFPTEQISDWSNGNVLDIGFSLKESAHYEGSFQCLCFADELTALLAYAMGTDTKTGAGDPWTHTLSMANSLPWLSVQAEYMESQIIDRVVDSKINKLTIDAERAKPVLATVDLKGMNPAVQGSGATVTFTDTIATEGPMMFYHGVITLTGPSDFATLAGQITKFSIEIDRNLAVEYGPGQVYPIYLLEQRRRIKVNLQALFSGPAAYNLTHYGTSAGTAFAQALGTGSAELKLTTASSPERSVDITVPNGTWQMAKPMYDPEGKPGLIDLTLVGYRSGATLPLTVVGKNGINTAYAP